MSTVNRAANRGKARDIVALLNDLDSPTRGLILADAVTMWIVAHQPGPGAVDDADEIHQQLLRSFAELVDKLLPDTQAEFVKFLAERRKPMQ